MVGFLKQETGVERWVTEPSGKLAASNASSLMSAEVQEQGDEAVSDDQSEELIRAAAELKGQQLVIPQLVVQQLAAQMTYDDLPDNIWARVDEVRGAAIAPKFQPNQLAQDLLSKWKVTRNPAAVA